MAGNPDPIDGLSVLEASFAHQIEVLPMLLEVRTICPPTGHTFPGIPLTPKGPLAILCYCERAILTGANGIVRVEVLS